MNDLPPVCREIVAELKKRGFRIVSAYYNEITDVCSIDFRDPHTDDVLKKWEGVVPKGWYTSSINYFILEREASINFNRVPKEDTFEFYIPEECGKGGCRLHIYFDEDAPKVGFEAKFIPKEKLKEIIDLFFY